MRVGLIIAVVLIAGCTPASHKTPSSADPSGPVDAAVIVETTVCEMGASPANFDRKLVRVDAYISRGFEDSGLHDPNCPDEAVVNMWEAPNPVPRIWIDWGSRVRYWRVQGYAPFVNDEQAKTLEAVLRARQQVDGMTRATLVGTFYAGEPFKTKDNLTIWRGHGHLGCRSLFVLSRVEDVQTDYSEKLSYSWADWHVGMAEGCAWEQMLGVPTNQTIRAWQQAASTGQDDWRYDPLRAANDHFQRLNAGEYRGKTGGRTEQLWPKPNYNIKPVEPRPGDALVETLSKPHLRHFEWRSPDGATRYIIAVSRPYWLELVAGSPDTVIWAPVGASVVGCKPSPLPTNKP